MSNLAGGVVGGNLLPRSTAKSQFSRRVFPTRISATAEVGQRPSTTGPLTPSLPNTSEPAPFIHKIPKSRWTDGIPPVMGAHLMASGTVAPISTSKGAGADVAEHQFQYPDGEYSCSVMQYASPAVASEGLAKMVLSAAESAIAKKGSFTMVLSGGSLVNTLGGLIDQEADFGKWHVFWVDERVVPHDSDDSNYKGAKDAFLSKVPIPDSNIYAIGEGMSALEAAKHYEGMLLGLGSDVLPKNEAGFPIFDTILLGVGPDGHVASLFPNRPQTAVTEGWVVHIEDSPKPPPGRITLTMPVINSAENVAVVALGEGKAEIVQRVLEMQALPGALPAQLVRPEAGSLTWVLDCGSAKELNITEWENRKSFPTSQF